MEEVIDTLKTAAISQNFGLDLPDEDQLVEIEEEILLPIPREFKVFLLNVSNLILGRLEPVTVTDPQAHTHLPEVTAQAWAEGLSREYIVVCQTGSSYYCINPQGEIYFWQDGQIASDRVWEDIWQWSLDVWLTS